MMFDTDVLVWVLRGNRKAARLVDKAEDRRISAISYLELLRGARNKRDLKRIKDFLADLVFRIVPLSENVGHRAMIYVEEYGLTIDMHVADALIAASAVENNLVLCTANAKHYRAIKELDLKIFKP